jgi:transcriptional regulator with XRE-family HTH domain
MFGNLRYQNYNLFSNSVKDVTQVILWKQMGTKDINEQNQRLIFKTWLEIAYLEWQAHNKKRATLDEFAKYIGYSRPLISMWLSGKRLPSEDGVRRLASLFGDELYDIMGFPRPDPLLESINSRWAHIPPLRQAQLARDAERYAAETEKNGSKNLSKSRKAESS